LGADHLSSTNSYAMFNEKQQAMMDEKYGNVLLVFKGRFNTLDESL
jgi:hypothetical protein